MLEEFCEITFVHFFFPRLILNCCYSFPLSFVLFFFLFGLLLVFYLPFVLYLYVLEVAIETNIPTT